MIIRQAVMRQGRRFAPSIRKTFIRPLSTIDTIEQSLASNLNETRSIESQLLGKASVLSSADASPEVPQPKARQAKKKPVDHNKAFAEQARHRRIQARTTGDLGSIVRPHYDPNALLRNPAGPSEITLEMLLAAQAHLGHSTSLWNPMNSRYIFGARQGIHIISLDVTAAHLRRACRIVHGVAEHGGLILFVGTRPGQDIFVVKAAKDAGACHLFTKWKPGAITNAEHVLRGLEAKAVDQYDVPIEGFDEELDELPKLKPDLVVCLNPLENWVLLHECALHQIPTIGVIDTDANPSWVTYPIPANDDSLRCTQVIAGALGVAGKEGTEARHARAQRGEVVYNPVNLEEVREEMAI